MLLDASSESLINFLFFLFKIQAVACFTDFVVKAVLPKHGVQKIHSVLRDRENELMCGGIDTSFFHNTATR